MSHENSDLPPELRELEAALATRALPSAAPAHRAKVLNAVRAEVAARKAPRSFWRFAAGAAAALLLGINLSMSAANDTVLRVGMQCDTSETQAALAQLREALPDISDAEAQRQLILLRARSQLVNTPQVRGGTRVHASTEGN